MLTVCRDELRIMSEATSRRRQHWIDHDRHRVAERQEHLGNQHGGARRP
jgi:hypothetical protein